MSTVTNLQAAIEEKAKDRLLKDIAQLSTEYETLVNRFYHVTSSVPIKITDPLGLHSVPYLRQLFKNEEIIRAIFSQHLDEYIQQEIAVLLNSKK